jgi:hypothetical protein
LKPEGCLMIFGGPTAYESRRQHKLKSRDVNAMISAHEAVLTYLKWSESAISMDRADHLDNIPQLGRFPLIVEPIVGKTCLTKVLMDGGSGLSILYAETYDAIGLVHVAEPLELIRLKCANHHHRGNPG